MMLETASLSSVLTFYFWHLLVSVLVSSLIVFILKKRYQDKALNIFFLILVFNIVIPVLGYIFTLWMAYYLLNVRYVKRLIHTKTLNMQELDHEFPQVKRMFGEGSMMELMSNDYAPKGKRLKALSVMAEDLNQKNIALIKHSLSDKDDEIRLFSFALIDNMEQNINTKIHNASLVYEKAQTAQQKAKAAKDLAYLYWDMVYFDLSDDTLKEYLLNEALKYALIVFRFDMSDASINILLGKIYLSKEDFEEASTQFIMAIESGMDNEYIIPYLAELYFKRKNFRSIRAMLNQVHGLGINAKMYPVIVQWDAHV